MDRLPTHSGFHGARHVASGSLGQVASAIKSQFADAHVDGLLIFNNATGRVTDLDFRGSTEEVLARLPAEPQADPAQTEAAQRGPGRPRLGVVAKEVTLLPRHWEWLATQPGGASVALRKLVEDARRANADKDAVRTARERAYHFMSAMLANDVAFEEASRALFTGKHTLFEELSASWPIDLRDHVRLLAAAAFPEDEAAA